jgi:hypothetical protein
MACFVLVGQILKSDEEKKNENKYKKKKTLTFQHIS